jgi:hypothetical protein
MTSRFAGTSGETGYDVTSKTTPAEPLLRILLIGYLYGVRRECLVERHDSTSEPLGTTSTLRLLPSPCHQGVMAKVIKQRFGAVVLPLTWCNGPVAVEKGTKSVISANFTACGERTINNLQTNFGC